MQIIRVTYSDNLRRLKSSQQMLNNWDYVLYFSMLIALKYSFMNTWWYLAKQCKRDLYWKDVLIGIPLLMTLRDVKVISSIAYLRSLIFTEHK